MARVRLTAAHNIDSKSRKAGTIIADSVANALPGDIVWTGLNAAGFSNAMVALDGGANTLQAASRFTTGPSVGCISGCNSIEG